MDLYKVMVSKASKNALLEASLWGMLVFTGVLVLRLYYPREL